MYQNLILKWCICVHLPRPQPVGSGLARRSSAMKSNLRFSEFPRGHWRAPPHVCVWKRRLLCRSEPRAVGSVSSLFTTSSLLPGHLSVRKGNYHWTATCDMDLSSEHETERCYYLNYTTMRVNECAVHWKGLLGTKISNLFQVFPQILPPR